MVVSKEIAMTTKQAPIPSGFGFQTTATEALAGRNLKGKIAIVTGGYSGIGTETTRVLANAGATVIVPVRTPEKAKETMRDIPNVELEPMDLGDPKSVDAFAKKFVDSGRPLHLLINSAGIMATPLTRDTRGYESQFAVNHLGHFQLAARLWPALKKAKGARVVSVSSRGHQRAGVDFDDPNFDRRDYEKWAAYGQAKTANVLFAVALDRRGEAHHVRAFGVHPGAIHTDLSRHMTDDDFKAMGIDRSAGTFRGIANANGDRPINQMRFKSVEQGAATQVWCATHAQLDGMGGVYCEDVDIARPIAADSSSATGVKPWAINPEFAERLWTLSEKLTGLTFDAS
jgi:NAD(P)-dependent dehydrogenase (short-subunit alcohol dehydrogenase family)